MFARQGEAKVALRIASLVSRSQCWGRSFDASLPASPDDHAESAWSFAQWQLADPESVNVSPAIGTNVQV
jgi:hypothetical protein